MKKLALGLAAAALCATGVASAMTFTQSAHGSTDGHSAEFSVSNDQMAASITAHPDLRPSDITDLAGGIPGVSDITRQIPGADAIDGLVDGLPSASDITSTVTSVLPSACGAGLPSLPLPTGSLKTVTDAAAGAVATVKGALPAQLPVSTPDVLGAAGHELGCLASTGAGPIPSLCSAGAGLPIPSALSSVVPAQLSGVLGTVLSDFGNVTGQAVTAGAGNRIGVSCSTSDLPDVTGTVTGAVDTVKGVAGNLPLPVPVPTVAGITGTATGAANTAVTTATGAPAIATGAVGGAVSTATGIAGSLPTAGDVNGAVNGAVGTVTGTVNSLLPGLSCNASGSASSGGILGGLLGGLSASVTGSC
jgi:hypothetical protein